MSSSSIAKLRELPIESNPRRARTIVAAATLSACYLLALWFTFTEAGRRSISLEIPSQGADYLLVDVNVVHVDLLRSELTTRISFRLAGALAQDELTPATDLQLLLNTVHGQQQFDFPKGQRINPIEAVFPLDGEVNRYPFDKHNGVIWIFATIAERHRVSSEPVSNAVSKNPAKSRKRVGVVSAGEKNPRNVPEELAKSPGLPMGTLFLETRVQADTRTKFTASVTGLTFRDSHSVQSVHSMKGLTGIDVKLRRSSNVVALSLATMCMMGATAVGLVIMVLRIVGGGRRMAAFHIPMAVSLIFGLPALRNVQPGIPPPGTFGDSVAFTWAEVAAAGSAIALMIHWLLHRTSDSAPPAKNS